MAVFFTKPALDIDPEHIFKFISCCITLLKTQGSFIKWFLRKKNRKLSQLICETPCNKYHFPINLSLESSRVLNRMMNEFDSMLPKNKESRTSRWLSRHLKKNLEKRFQPRDSRIKIKHFPSRQELSSGVLSIVKVTSHWI